MECNLIQIGKEQYIANMMITTQERKDGVRPLSFLPPDEVYVFPCPDGVVVMTMEGVLFPIVMIGIDTNNTVNKIVKKEVGSEDEKFENVKYVIELSTDNENLLSEGDIYTLVAPLDDYAMKILDKDGSTQFILKGGERIFSRVSTNKILSRAKKAYLSKSEKDYKALGLYIFSEMDRQDNRPPQYVTHVSNNNNGSNS